MLGRLLDRLLGILIENAGAQRGVLLLSRDGELYVEAEGSVVSDEVAVLMSIPIDSADGAASGSTRASSTSPPERKKWSSSTTRSRTSASWRTLTFRRGRRARCSASRS